jgi:hypothetical protein
MGITINCKEKCFSCSYSTWNDIRINIIEATFRYLENKFILDKNDVNSDIDMYEDSIYNCSKDYIEEFIVKMNTLNNSTFQNKRYKFIDNFIVTIYNINFLDALIYFDVGGLFSLINKSDINGFYSPGNSLDICMLFDEIKPIIEESYKDDFSTIYNILYDIFYESWNEKLIVTIG